MSSESADLTVYNLFQAVSIAVGVVSIIQLTGGINTFSMSGTLMTVIQKGVAKTLAQIPQAIFSGM